MSFPRTARVSAVLALVLTAALVAGCAPASDDEAAQTPPAVSTPDPSATDDVAEPIEEPETPVYEAPTCETMISQDVVADFADAGWSPKEGPFYLGNIEVEGGIQCAWSDYEGQSGDLQLFGWAPIDEESATEAQDALTTEGWVLEEEADGVYLTENPSTAFAVDEDGYGMTYFFGAGWVSLAGTKQGLLLIDWPQV